MKTLICIDRDGTLIHDTKEHVFLGSTNDWKNDVTILPGVVEGVMLLQSLPDAHVYMMTNQSGIAIKELPLLTEERAHEVCRYVADQINQDGCLIEDFFACPHVDAQYFVDHPQYHPIHEMVLSCECIKPRLGMVLDALKKEGVDYSQAHIYVIGDRASDVSTGINAGGIGVLVPFVNQPGEVQKVEALRSKDAHIATGFVDACRFIVRREE